MNEQRAAGRIDQTGWLVAHGLAKSFKRTPVVNSAGTLHGPELVLNLAEQTSVFSSSGGGRVTGVFTPPSQ